MMISHETGNYRGWESIPAPLLELIMERLRFVDRLRFTAVCKWWKNAFDDYPRKQFPYGAPLLLVTKSFKEDEKILFDPWTKKELIVIQDDDFRNTMHLGSKEGWILLATSNYSSRYPSPHCSPSYILLYNPFTKRKLKLPKLKLGDHGIKRIHSGDIVMKNGYPDMVVLTGKKGGSNLSLTLLICRLEDEAWEAHAYNGRWWNVGHLVVVIERSVYLVDRYGRIIGFDLTQSKWSHPLGRKGCGPGIRGLYYVACDGEIFRVWPLEEGMTGKSVRKFLFDRFNFSRSVWETVPEEDLQGKCLCLADCDSTLSYATLGTEKVHHLISNGCPKSSYSLKDYHLTAPKSTVENVFQEELWEQVNWVHI